MEFNDGTGERLKVSTKRLYLTRFFQAPCSITKQTEIHIHVLNLPALKLVSPPKC